MCLRTAGGLHDGITTRRPAWGRLRFARLGDQTNWRGEPRCNASVRRVAFTGAPGTTVRFRHVVILLKARHNVVSIKEGSYNVCGYLYSNTIVQVHLCHRRSLGLHDNYQPPSQESTSWEKKQRHAVKRLRASSATVSKTPCLYLPAMKVASSIVVSTNTHHRLGGMSSWCALDLVGHHHLLLSSD